MTNFSGKPDNMIIRQTGGQQEDQQESLSFLFTALIIALGMIFGILVLQFNSLSKPFIVLNEIFFSIIGVFFGFAFTGMKMPLIMVAVGIVGLAGIVVKNAILLIEFTDELRRAAIAPKKRSFRRERSVSFPYCSPHLPPCSDFAAGSRTEYQLGLLSAASQTKYFLRRRQRGILGTIVLDPYFRIDLRILHDPADGAFHVPDAERLRRPMSKFYGTKWVALLGFTGPFFFILVFIMWIYKGYSKKTNVPEIPGI